MPIVEGAPAPDFTLPDQDGRPLQLSSLRGRHVIVYFYPRDNTPGCTREAEGFRDLYPQFQQLGAEVVGISPDSDRSHQGFICTYGLTFPLLSDREKTVMAAWGAFGEKTLYGKKVQGVIRSTVWIGPDGLVRRHWPKVTKAAEHPLQVLETLKLG